MNSQVKLQIPMDKSVRDGFEAYAKSLGFDSAQAYVRVLAKAKAEGRHLDFGEDTWGQPSPEAAARLNRWSEESKTHLESGKLKKYTSAKEFMKDL